MDNYKNILVAVDLSEDSEHVCRKALRLAQDHQARLTLLYVAEIFYQMSASYDPLFYPAYEDIALDEEEILKISRTRMDELVQSLAVDENIELYNKVIVGIPKTEIVEMAEQQQVDLIVCGSHGRNGIELLLGSTANAILHHAPCDVLAVRTRKKAEDKSAEN